MNCHEISCIHYGTPTVSGCPSCHAVKPLDPNFGTGVDVLLSGDELIAIERAEQVLKHNKPIVHDLKKNQNGELIDMAEALILDCPEHAPNHWDRGIVERMMAKTKQQRYVYAGALIAAEIDRLNLLAQITAANEQDV